jgi:hypothetical protein
MQALNTRTTREQKYLENNDRFFHYSVFTKGIDARENIHNNLFSWFLKVILQFKAKKSLLVLEL